MLRERDLEAYLVAKVKELGYETRKVQWVGRNSAPDRVVFKRDRRLVWIELKAVDCWAKFPSNPHERAQAREHERLRDMGQDVRVCGTTQSIDAALA